jgi:hypothetical protein
MCVIVFPESIKHWKSLLKILRFSTPHDRKCASIAPSPPLTGHQPFARRQKKALAIF